ncbi:MAG TPA: class I SAM-dependent methyltransferase [Armatimonadota bacterium]|nr:class I SAM-dependent methyltransferase [Armatimonadota bacterium]
MNGYAPETYGDCIAGIYDELYPTVEPAMIDTLARLAASGPALELGIGTGRVALPLQARGVCVHGVDASSNMVACLREKPGGAEIPVTMADFSAFQLPDRYALVYVPFNTFFALLSQEDQVRCFQTAAAHLVAGGRFLIEVFVPDLSRFDRGQRVHANRVGVDSLTLDASIHDPVAQRVDTQHMLVRDGNVRLYPVRIRYAFPAELDLMARLAGLRLEHRWAGWREEPFSAEAQSHVSVYVRD